MITAPATLLSGFMQTIRFALCFFLLTFLVPELNAQYHSLCWKISGNNLKQPSFLYGTMHVSDKRVFNFSDKTNKAFSDSKAFAMELDPEKALSVSTVTKMIMTDGHKISNMIPDSDYHFLDSLMLAGTGVGIALYDNIEPIIVSSLIEEFAIGLNESDSSNMADFLDLFFYNKARKAKMKIIGIESVDEQIAALHSLSYQEQAQMLVESLQEIKSGKNSSDADLLKYYMDQDLDSILINSDEQQMPAKFYKALVTDRNLHMADRIAGFIQKQATFIAVGAMHLPGQDGVIGLLRKRGFKVQEWR